MEELNELKSHIDNVLKDVKQMADDFINQKEFSHYNSFLGAIAPTGILGSLREKSEQKKLRKFLETKIYKDMSFDQIGYKLVTIATDLCNTQIKIQKLLQKEDEDYYGYAVKIIDEMELCRNRWFNISPKVAMESLTLADGTKIQWGPQVEYEMQSEYIKMDLPDEPKYKTLKKEVEKAEKGSTGCLVLLMILSSSFLVACSFF